MQVLRHSWRARREQRPRCSLHSRGTPNIWPARCKCSLQPHLQPPTFPLWLSHQRCGAEMALASPLTSSTRQGMAVRAAGAPASRLAPRATRLEVAAPGLQKPQKVQEASNIVELPAEAAAARRWVAPCPRGAGERRTPAGSICAATCFPLRYLLHCCWSPSCILPLLLIHALQLEISPIALPAPPSCCRAVRRFPRKPLWKDQPLFLVAALAPLLALRTTHWL